jgi:hypothetical protein
LARQLLWWRAQPLGARRGVRAIMGCGGSKDEPVFTVRQPATGPETQQAAASESDKDATAALIQRAAASRVKAPLGGGAAAAGAGAAGEQAKKPAITLDVGSSVSSALESTMSYLQESARAIQESARSLFGAVPPFDEAMAPGLKRLYAASGNSGKLTRAELEACLRALGLRKGVLLLACKPLDGFTTSPTGTVPLHAYWMPLNPRSRIVIESKMNSTDSVDALLDLAVTIASAETAIFLDKRRVHTKAALRAVLASVELADAEAFLAEYDDDAPIQLSLWFAKLEPKLQSRLIDALGLLDDADDAPTAPKPSPSPAKRSGLAARTPKADGSLGTLSEEQA